MALHDKVVLIVDLTLHDQGLKFSTETKQTVNICENLHFLCLHVLIKVSAVVWLKKTGMSFV